MKKGRRPPVTGGPHEMGQEPSLGAIPIEFDEDESGEDGRGPPRRRAGRIRIEDDHYRPIHDAHEICREALKDASSGVVRAFYRNVLKDSWTGRVKDGAIAVGAFAVGTAVADPVIGTVLAALGGMARNAWKTVFHRRKKDVVGRPDLPELRSYWNQTCYRFARIVHGYNLRVGMIERLRQDARRLQSARAVLDERIGEDLSKAPAGNRLIDEFEERLSLAEQKLHEIAMVLVHLAADDRGEREERVLEEDPLGHYTGRVIPEIAWLDDDRERIGAAKVSEQIREDLLRIANEAELDDFIREAEEAFRGLEEEHGEEAAAVDREREDEKDE